MRTSIGLLVAAATLTVAVACCALPLVLNTKAVLSFSNNVKWERAGRFLTALIGMPASATDDFEISAGINGKPAVVTYRAGDAVAFNAVHKGDIVDPGTLEARPSFYQLSVYARTDSAMVHLAAHGTAAATMILLSGRLLHHGPTGTQRLPPN